MACTRISLTSCGAPSTSVRMGCPRRRIAAMLRSAAAVARCAPGSVTTAIVLVPSGRDAAITRSNCSGSTARSATIRPRNFFTGRAARASVAEPCMNQVGTSRTASRAPNESGDAVPCDMRRNSTPRPLRRSANAASRCSDSLFTITASAPNSRSSTASRSASDSRLSRPSNGSTSRPVHAAATADAAGQAIAAVTPRAASARPISVYTRATPFHRGDG